MKKKVINLIFALCISTSAFANGVEDARISFSTEGPDRYADGSVVLDGECYALVWSKDGDFNGFDANGACNDAEDRIVLVAPVAKGGRCPKVLFQIPAAEANEQAGGKYAVYLLDTRVAVGGTERPRGTVDGKPALMNGYGAATANLALGQVFGASKNVPESESAGKGQVAGVLCAAPSGCAQPRVKAMRIEGDNVFLTVENLGGFMRVSSGGDVSASASATAAVETSGEGGDVVLVTRKPGASGFFKVIRNGN